MKSDIEVFPIEKSVGFVIHLMDRELSLGLQNQFKSNGFDITPEHWSVLNKLWEKDGIHQSELAKRSHKDRHNMTRIIGLLEKKGYIYRQSGAKDKRIQTVYLSERGKAIRESLILIVQAFLEKAFQGISKSQLQAMHQLHLQVLSNLSFKI